MLAHPHQPDPQVIADCFERLFSHVTIDGQIEIAYTLPDSNAPKQARMFKVEDYAEAADFAAQINATPGQNVYFGPAIRRPNQPHSRGGDADVVALYTLFADFDDDGASAAATAKMKELGIEAPITVVTGRHPHLRSHKYLPLVEPIRDHALMRNALAHIADLLDGDPACKNQGRLMRIPGSVAWPKKAGRQTEMTELHMPHGRRQQFNLGEITRHQASPQMPLAAPRNDHTGTTNAVQHHTLHIRNGVDAQAAKDRMLQGDNWHHNMVAITAHLVATDHTDEAIQDYLADTTLPGYTQQQTIAEVQEAIDGARRKGYAPPATLAHKAATIIKQEQEAEKHSDWDAGNADNHIQITWFGDIEASTDTQDFVEDTLGIGQMSVVYGESNSGKTFFACDLALHTSMGWDWRGKETDQTGVIYLALEGKHGITNRMIAFRDHYKDKMMGEIPPFGIITTSVNLLDPEADTARLIDSIKAVNEKMPRPVGLIVIDTLSRAISGGNENSPDDMGAIVINSDRIRQQTGAHVMFIHHSGKDQARGARGHSLLRAATDTEIEVRREGDTVSIAAVKKQREFEGGQEYPFGLKQVILGLNKRDKEVTSCVVVADVEAPQKKQRGRPKDKLNINGERALEVLHSIKPAEFIIHQASQDIPNGIKTIREDVFEEACRASGKYPSARHSDNYRRMINNLLNTGIVEMNRGFLWEVDAQKELINQGDDE
jgi:hypothetical protein